MCLAPVGRLWWITLSRLDRVLTTKCLAGKVPAHKIKPHVYLTHHTCNNSSKQQKQQNSKENSQASRPCTQEKASASPARRPRQRHHHSGSNI